MPLPAQPNQSLIHGLACLQTVVGGAAAMGSREVARILGLEHTKVNRLLGTLCHLGLVERTASRKYRPGPGIHLLSAQSLRGSGLLAAALPLLEPLGREELIVSLGVLWDQHVCYLVRALPGQSPAAAIGAHAPHPAHLSILGLALLAGMPDTEIRRRLGRAPLSLAAEDLSRLLRECAATRQQGHAERRDARQRTYALAVPIGQVPVAAVGVTGIRRRRDIPRLVKALQGIASALG